MFGDNQETTTTHTQCCRRRVDGEKCSNSYIIINCGQIAPPPHRLTIMSMHYDYDIIMSSGGNRSPMLDLAQGVVAPRDGHSQCPRGSRSS